MPETSWALDWARVIGTTSAGITTGIMLGIPYIQIPVERAALNKLSLHDRLHLWSRTFSFGAARIVPLMGISSASLFLAAYLTSRTAAYIPQSSPFLTWIASYRQLVLAMSGISMLMNGPWTLIVMHPTIFALQEKEKKADADPDFNLQDTPKLIEWWSVMHGVRIAFAAVAFTGGMLDLVAG